MAFVLTNRGEEYVIKTAVSGVTLTVLLYNDVTDAATDTFDLADLTTEPSDGSYARQSATFNPVKSGGNWQVDTDTDLVFDVTSTTGTVDAYAIVANFTSVDAGDGSATDHIIATGALDQSRNLGNLSELTLSAGSVGVSLD